MKSLVIYLHKEFRWKDSHWSQNHTNISCSTVLSSVQSCCCVGFPSSWPMLPTFHLWRLSQTLRFESPACRGQRGWFWPHKPTPTLRSWSSGSLKIYNCHTKSKDLLTGTGPSITSFLIFAKLNWGGGDPPMVWYGMVIRLGLSASLLAGRIAETPLSQLPPGPG